MLSAVLVANELSTVRWGPKTKLKKLNLRVRKYSLVTNPVVVAFISDLCALSSLRDAPLFVRNVYTKQITMHKTKPFIQTGLGLASLSLFVFIKIPP